MQSTNVQPIKEQESPKTEQAQQPEMVVFRSSSRSRAGSSMGVTPDAGEHKLVNQELQALVEKGATKTTLITFLLDRNWSTSAICDKIRYESDTAKHKAGDRLLPQHVNQVKQKWIADRNVADKK